MRYRIFYCSLLAAAVAATSANAAPQTGDDLLNRYSAAKERCQMQYRHSVERANLARLPESRQRLTIAAERRVAACNLAADQNFERLQMAQQRRQSRSRR